MLSSYDKIVVVGCGGIGSWLIPPLVRFIWSEHWTGQLFLCDGDHYTAKNAARQDFRADATGTNKAEAQCQMLRDQYPSLDPRSLNYYVDDQNVDSIVVEGSIVFVGVDNHPARARIDRAATRRRNCCVFSAGNEELQGNVTVSLRREGAQLTRTLLERHPEVGTTMAHDRSEGCEDLIADGQTQLLITNHMAAASAMMVFHRLWRATPARLPQDIYFDIGTAQVSTVEVDYAVPDL
jgi:molybdopterin/thiamine biosynthesis adenylyltransferase